MKKTTLNGEWRLYYRVTGDEDYSTKEELESSNFDKVNATVPGNCELELSKAGILPSDLFFAQNIKKVDEYQMHEWYYVRDFFANEEQKTKRCELYFHGVDCFADYYLNGEKIGHSENALIAHAFDVTGKLKDKNTLIVHIKSTMLESHKYTSPVYSLAYANNCRIEFQTIRKPAHSFGWDIMPRCMTSGIWRDCEIRTYDDCEIDDCYITTMYINDDGSADVAFCWTLKCTKDLYIKGGARFYAKAVCGDSVIEKSTHISTNIGTLHMHIPNAKIWNVRGYGEPNVYDVKMSIRIGDEVLAERDDTFGIRKVELRRTDIADGVEGEFRFIVNGTPVFATGTNWVPLDAFHSRDRERAPKALKMMYDCGCNIVRVWGGSVYECDEFYDFCDRNGIMIWQDFCMACNFYPQEDRFYDVIKKEALFAVKRLRNHPSIALWSGDNECDDNYASENRNPDENKITREILRDIVLYNDLSRPYLPSSPYISGDLFKLFKNRKTDSQERASEAHLWGPRAYFKEPFYKKATCCFVSESGYHGCPSKKEIVKFISPDKVWSYKNNEEWNLHSTMDNVKNSARIDLMEKQVIQLFGFLPDNIDEYTLASQISQAEAKKYFIERMRINRPYAGGIIWWNLIDGWPEMSDAVVDYYYEPKLAYSYITRVQKPFVIMMGETESWGNRIVASNITSKAASGNYSIKDALTGEALCEGEYSCPANENSVIGFLPVMYSDKKFLLIEWNDGEEKGFNHYVTGSVPMDFEKYKKFLPVIEKGIKWDGVELG